MTGERPAALGGMRHVALFVERFEACEQFYVEWLGMAVEWRPDPDNVYLSSGVDNVALHRGEKVDATTRQRLDHIGFIVNEIDDVDRWYQFLKSKSVEIKTEPRTHRDGARSFYCLDPDGTMVQMIYHPPISGLVLTSA